MLLLLAGLTTADQVLVGLHLTVTARLDGVLRSAVRFIEGIPKYAPILGNMCDTLASHSAVHQLRSSCTGLALLQFTFRNYATLFRPRLAVECYVAPLMASS